MLGCVPIGDDTYPLGKGQRMKQSTKIALIGAGAGVLSMAAVAVTSIAQAESTNTSSTVDMAITNSSSAPSTLAPPMMGRHGGPKLDELAAELGITTTQLQTELDSGKEFYQIAAEHGLTYDKLKAQHDAKVKARLDEMVKVEFLTQAEAEQQWSTYQTKSPDMPMFGMGMGRHGEF